MSTNPSELLFSPEGAPLRDPAELDRALADLWKTAPGPDSPPSETKIATRVSVANLITVAPEREWNTLQEILAELSNDYPTRTIVLLIGEQAGAEITASVSAICRVPQNGEVEVCCEQIIVRGGARHVEDLDQTLLPLLESDVPVMCWWRAGARAWPHLFEAIHSLARRVIIDEPGIIPDLPQVRSTTECAVRDLGWYRTAGLRELVAQMFDGSPPEVARSIESLDLDSGPSAVDETNAFWLTAFVAGQLGWTPTRVETSREPAAGINRTLCRFESDGRELLARITRRTDGGDCLHRVAIRSGADRFTLEYHPAGVNEYRLTICSQDICQAPRSMQVRCLRPSEALSAALVGRPVDRAYDRAHAVLKRLAHLAT